MRWRGVAALLLTAVTSTKGASAEVVTITQHASICSAIYTSGSRSVTIVQPNITVLPVPFTDEDANNGTPFVLEVKPGSSSGSKRKRETKVPVWLMSNGNTTTDGSEAAQYVIDNGVLSAVNGGYVSTAEGIPSQPFAVSLTRQPIDMAFFVQLDVLNWQDPAFTHSIAQFFQVPSGVRDDAEILAKFSGPTNPSWAPVLLLPRPVGDATHTVTASTSILTGINIVSMSSGPFPISNGGSQGEVGPPSTTGLGNPPVPQSVGSSTNPMSTLQTSPNGQCGGSTRYTCVGNDLGQCCSQYGYCGGGTLYCGSGCQQTYGACSRYSNTTGNASTVSPLQSPPAGGSTPITNGASSMQVMSIPIASSSAFPVASFTCPAVNGQIVTDQNGIQYNIACGRDTTIGAYGSAQAPNSFDDCFSLCDAEAYCTAFTYVGGVNGVGYGKCYFKNQEVAFINSGSKLVAAIRLSPFPSGSSATQSTLTAPASPIGPNHPGGATGSMPVPLNMSTTYMLSLTPSMAPSMSPSMNESGYMASTSSVASPSNMPSNSSTGSVSPNGHCGVQGNGGTPNGYTCSGSLFGMCCSSSGFCGNSTSYCVSGCQSDYGSCTPQGSQPVTLAGECGVNWGGQTCTGGIFGPCCSTSGYCGSLPGYCDPENCDPNFGTCNAASSSTMVTSSSSMPTSMSSSMMASSSSSMSPSSSAMPSLSSQMASSMASSSTSGGTSSSTMMSSSSPMSSSSVQSTMSTSSSAMMTISSSSSSPAMSSSSMATTSTTSGQTHASSGPVPPCPAGNGTGYTDPAGNQYMILCDLNTNPSSFNSLSETSFQSCINACASQTMQQCVAVTYLGGVCYFKAAYSSDDSAPGTDAAVLASVLGVSPATYTAPTPSSTSSSASSSVAFSSMATSSSMSTSSGSTMTSMSSSSPSSIAASSTSSSVLFSSPTYLVLASPTPCTFGDPAGTSEDDSFCAIALPFTMQMYAQTNTTTYASTNGYISLVNGSTQYEAQPLPASNIPNNTVCPFFDDLYLDADSSPPQGIFFQFNQAQTGITYEYYLGRPGVAGEIYHFTVAYDSAQPGVFTYTYYDTGGSTDDGEYCTVGTQGINSSGNVVGFTYSYSYQDITPGLVVLCNTQANTCVTSSNTTTSGMR